MSVRGALTRPPRTRQHCAGSTLNRLWTVRLPVLVHPYYRCLNLKTCWLWLDKVVLVRRGLTCV